MVVHDYVKKTATSGKPDLSPDTESGVASSPHIELLAATAPWSWLKQGLVDLRLSHLQSLLYGLFFVLMGLGIDRAHEGNQAFALALSLAFIFAGPFLSIGLYELSRQIQAGEKTDLVLSLFSWCRNPAAVGRFAFYLSIVMVIWLWLSSILLTTEHRMQGVLFAGMLLLWLSMAILVFTASVVAIPMMLDRPVNAMQAVRSSMRCCRVNSQALAIWAMIVACSVGFSLALAYWPLLLIGPLLGHATWHAYQAMLTFDDAGDSRGTTSAGT